MRNATIVLLAYPELFSRTQQCSEVDLIGLQEGLALNELADHMDMRQEELRAELEADGLTMFQTDPVQEFLGHGVCDDPSWINGLIAGPNGEGDFHEADSEIDPELETTCIPWLGVCASRESFHPNSRGTVGYANVLGDHLELIDYIGG